MVDLKSFGSIPRMTERLETSEQLEMADNFLCMSVDNLRLEIFLSMILPWKMKSTGKIEKRISFLRKPHDISR